MDVKFNGTLDHTLDHKVLHLNDEEYESLFVPGSRVIVKYSTEWCGPCKKIEPTFQEYSLKFPNITFVNVSADDDDFEHEHLDDIKTVPTFKFFVDGNLKYIFTGADHRRLEKYTTKLNKLGNETC